MRSGARASRRAREGGGGGTCRGMGGPPLLPLLLPLPLSSGAVVGPAASHPPHEGAPPPQTDASAPGSLARHLLQICQTRPRRAVPLLLPPRSHTCRRRQLSPGATKDQDACEGGSDRRGGGGGARLRAPVVRACASAMSTPSALWLLAPLRMALRRRKARLASPRHPATPAIAHSAPPQSLRHSSHRYFWPDSDASG